MKYFIQQNGIYSQVDELTNPSYFKELVSKGSREITQEEFEKATYVPEFEIDPKENRKVEIKARLNKLSEDMIQYMYGETITDIASRKVEFIELHNELRVLEGKQPRANNLDNRRL